MKAPTGRSGARAGTAGEPRLLHSLFQESAARWPQALAVATSRVTLTYAELDDVSGRVASRIRSCGGAPDDLVAVAMRKGWEQVAAVLGVLRAGAAYLPVDADLPGSRVRELLERSGARILLTQPALALPALPAGLEVIEVSAGLAAAGAGPGDPAGVRPEHLAYVLFTSGSTGVPKGVMIEHAGVVNTVRDLNDRFKLGPGDRFLGLSSLSFDMSVYDMFGAFGAGGALVLPDPQDARNPAAWVELMRRFDVTVWNSVPMLLAMLVSWLEETGQSSPAALRLAVLGGDWIPLDLPDRARAFFDGLEIVNIGGATEASICSCLFVVDRVDPAWRGVPYGKALSGQYWRVLDTDLQDCPAGEVGELYIGGVGVGRGYLNDPAQTAASFLTHPVTGERLYRTGDLGQWMADGNIELLGRRDQQVKVRGHRIELGEIEAHALAHPLVRQAVAVAVGPDRQLDRIVLFVTGGAAPPGGEQVRSFLRERLPGYLVPDRCLPVDTLPLTPNGKVDRAALAGRARSLAGSGQMAAPVGGTEQRLGQLWHDLLPAAGPPGRDTGFFAAGGNSLLATSLAGRIRRAFEVEVSPGFVFAHPTIAAMAAALADLAGSDARPAPPAPGRELTFGQEQLWYLDQLAGAGRAYQFQASIRFRGDLDVALLQRALTAVVARHEALRTTYADTGGGPRPAVHPPYQVELVVEDLRAVPDLRRQDALREAMDREIDRTFDLSQLPLIRWRLFRTGEQDWTLTEVEHHIVHDGWSVALLWREVAAMYTAWRRGAESGLLALELQLGEFAARQRDHYRRRRRQLLRYWTRQLAGAAPVELPIARRRPPRQTFAGASRRVVLSPELYRQLRQFARRQGCSLYAVMLTAYKLLLHRYTGEADLCVGTWLANRLHPEAEHLIGMLANMVVLRDHLPEQATVESYLAQVTGTAVAAFDHQDAPFPEVVRAVGPPRDPSRNPLVQVCFSFHDSPVPEFGWPGLAGVLVEEHNRSAKFDLNLVVVPHAEQRRVDELRPGVDQLVAVWEYNSDLFDPADIDRLIGHYQQVLQAMLADPGARAWQLDLRTAAERQQAESWQGGPATYPEATLPELVFAQARSTPDAVAVSCHEQRMSYRELATRAAEYAAGLRAAGIGGGDLVAVCLDRSPDLVACLLAVMAAGAAYVPLDPTHPAARHRLITDTAGVKAVVHDGAPDRFAGLTGPVLSTQQLRATAPPAGGVPAVAAAGDRAYVMFTSGSTGRPNGVAVAHRSIVNLIWDLRRRLGLRRDDVVAAVTTVAFDISVLELFGVLTLGGRVEVVPAETIARPADLVARLADSAVSVVQATPAMWRLLLASGLPVPAGRLVALCGGEACPPDLAAAIVRHSSQAWNVYGPTETTIWSAAHRLTAADGAREPVPIGKPLANTTCWVLSRHGVPQPVGLPGELHIGGTGVALGYLGAGEQPARRFGELPGLAGAGGRCFATGDVVRWNRDGELEFLGRHDTQVKLRGYRIELGEVEAVLCAHPQVRNAAVVLANGSQTGGPDTEPFLAAYLETSAAGAGAIRRHLRAHLPAYLEPQRIVRVDALPTTPSGKIDRARLAALPATDLPATDLPATDPPVTADGQTERVLAEIFAEVLGVGEVDPHADFFELGGHSLLALRLAHRVRETLAVDIGLEQILDHGSVRELAEVLDR